MSYKSKNFFLKCLNNSELYIVFILFIFGIGLALFLPLYPDEFTDRLFWERFFITGGYKQSVAPFCLDGFLVRPPLPLLPAAIFWSLLSLFGSSLIAYRIIPIMALSAIVGMLISNAKRYGRVTLFPLLLLVVLGPLPFGFVVLRPEVIILAGGLAIYMLGRSMINATNKYKLLFIAFMIIIIYEFLLYLHPKAIYLSFPVLVVFGFGALRWRKGWQRMTWLTTTFGVSGWITQAAINLHRKQSTTCSGLQNIQDLMAVQSVDLTHAFLEPGLFLNELQLDFSLSLWQKFIKNMTYIPKAEIYFIPNIQLHWQEILVNWLIVILIAGLAVYALIKLIYCLVTPQYRREALMIAALAIGLTTHVLLNLTKSWYEASYAVGDILIIAGLLWPIPISFMLKHTTSTAKLMSISLIYVTLISLILNFKDYTLWFIHGWQGAGVSIFTKREQLSETLPLLLQQHDVSINAPVIVEDMTYDAMRQHPIVIPLTYMGFAAIEPGKFQQTISQYNVEYAVISCQTPPWLENEVKLEKLGEVLVDQFHSPICLFRMHY